MIAHQLDYNVIDLYIAYIWANEYEENANQTFAAHPSLLNAWWFQKSCHPEGTY
jgi:hypothetical protein